jgi:predicted dehydrogenase
MDPISRRRFIERSVATGALTTVASILPSALSAAAVSPNETIQVGVIGVGGKGLNHVDQLTRIAGTRVVALCDVDPARVAQAQALLDKTGVKAKHYQDMREVLDNPEIDAVTIATPNHWHATATIWACQKGKDVYCEKPVTHNLWEGQRVVDAARKYDRIVQAGTQNRSDTGFRQAIEYIREGALGKILWMHGLWFKDRASIGYVTGPQLIPPGLDYNLWTGPAPLEPLMRKNLHYDWHWNWDTGNGDMGNLGAHQIDDCAHVLNVETTPTKFLGLGGRFARTDDGETPNMQAVLFEFENAPPCIVEVRGLTERAGSTTLPKVRGLSEGNIVQCENGYFAGGRGGGTIYDNSGKPLKQFPGDGGATHMENWIEAVRSRKPEGMRAEIAVGVRSANLCHLANLAYRSGLPTATKEITSRFSEFAHAAEAVDAIAANLAAHDVDLNATPLACSGWMGFDPQKMEFSGTAHETLMAGALAMRTYREPFVTPANV